MNRKEMLRRLQAADFALKDAALFLDTHPEDEKALAYYHKTRAEVNEMTRRYEEVCGPLTAAGVQNKQYWDWIKEPWPWERTDV